MARHPRNVTTASALEGWTIEEHFGVVASHVVAGTGMFSDFAAGLSDIFGGRSATYQSQLSSLYQEAITRLVGRAEHLGGNWIIGLGVDIDEISGKGMQMFMVTAIGTAVRAVRARPEGPTQGAPLGGATVEELATEVRRRQLEKSAAQGTLLLGDTTWDFISSQRMAALAPAVMLWLAERWKMSGGVVDTSVWERPLAFFRSLPAPQSSKALYEALRGSYEEAKAATQLIKDLSLMDLGCVAELLRAGPQDARRCALQTLAADQPLYAASDLAFLDDVIALLRDAFPADPEVVRSKGMLGGKKERWVCGGCGQLGNSLDATRCTRCGRDVQGFLTSELTPSGAVNLLNEKRAALAALVGSSPAA